MTSATVRLAGRRVHLVTGRGNDVKTCHNSDTHTALSSPRQLEGELRQALSRDTNALATLRTLVIRQVGATRLHRMRDTDVLTHVGHMLSTGELTAVECRPLLRAAKPAVTEALEPETVAPKPTPTKVKTWIEIELVDDQGQPVPSERYEVELPDGTTTSGTLDRNGRARVSEIDPPGVCQVSFPDIDGREWQSA